MKISRCLVGMAAATFLLGAGPLSAQSLEFKGTTTGCFAGGAISLPMCNTTTSLAMDNYLLFVGGSFDQWSSDGPVGYTGIGSDPTAPGSNFGYMSLGGLPADYTDNVFKLAINFTAPANVSPDAVFEAVLFGNVSWYDDGGVLISFGSPATFTFDGPDYTGTFDLWIDDLAVQPGTILDPQPVAITGFIESRITGNVTATPEPGTIALMATGLVGLIPVVRMRRKKNDAV